MNKHVKILLPYHNISQAEPKVTPRINSLTRIRYTSCKVEIYEMTQCTS